MKTLTKLLSLVLLGVMVFGFASCGGGEKPIDYDDPYAEWADNYEELSQHLYDDTLGEFYTAYTAAKAATSVSERYALMAIAEAKLMASAVMLPLSSAGGNYAISKAAPNTVPFALWGNDSYRYHNIVVATTPITAADRTYMKEQYAKFKTGEMSYEGGYEAWAERYLNYKGYTLKDSYTISYSSDPKTWDVLATSRAADSEAIVNTYDGLVEYDCEGNLVPALALSWSVSDDGLVYTFNLRTAGWANSQGQSVGKVTADDFVAGMQHMLDAKGGLEYLVNGIIKNAGKYIDGEITDFSQVGVKAIDEKTLQYTLEEPCSFFMTMLGYGVFAPMNRAFYESKGGKFGAEYDPSADSYVYGKTPDDIAYCGPYTVTNLTAKNTIVFELNPKYWNQNNVNMKKIVWLFNDGEDANKGINDLIAGTVDASGLNANAVAVAKTAKISSAADALSWFDAYSYVTSTDATSYMSFYNINRAAFANFDDESAVVSPQSANDRIRTKAALRNVNFRRAISFALDRVAYNGTTVGDELAAASLRNCYTPGNFVQLSEDVTVSINGTATTFEAGTFYGEIMQAQIDADGFKVTVWDPTLEGGLGSSDTFDGWYNVNNAVAELDLAIAALAEDGIEISVENPIELDLPVPTGSPVYNARGQVYKQSIENALGGKVIVNIVACDSYDEWYSTGYYTESGAQANYDMYDLSGWGPDYGDAQTYLDTMLPYYSGYMIKCLGIY